MVFIIDRPGGPERDSPERYPIALIAHMSA